MSHQQRTCTQHNTHTHPITGASTRAVPFCKYYSHLCVPKNAGSYDGNDVNACLLGWAKEHENGCSMYLQNAGIYLQPARVKEPTTSTSKMHLA